MTIVEYSPWTLLNRVRAELLGNLPFCERVADGSISWSPAVDIREHDDRYVLYVDVPGVDPKELELAVGNGILTIKGSRGQENLEARPGLRHLERRHGDFCRSFVLPDTADADRVSGSQRNGVVEIVVPKKEEIQPRKIVVN
ncbi:MAG: Hsp20/alpha crystallin family protein [Gammaproteobacteria bacterium]